MPVVAADIAVSSAKDFLNKTAVTALSPVGKLAADARVVRGSVLVKSQAAEMRQSRLQVLD